MKRQATWRLKAPRIGILPGFVTMCLASLLVLISAPMAGATEEYATQTGKSCAVCHLDPGGGGELTAAGKAFAEQRQGKTEQPQKSILSRSFRLAIGYSHFLTAILWFGTILYVHLVLKPAYAASGLPRGEMRVGIVSMVVMGITGTILTIYRVPSLDTLVHTRFGILLIIKVCLYLVMVLSALFVVTVIGPRLKAGRRGAAAAPVSGDLTLEELASCDGKDGRPAYFAFEGNIYDATQSRLWAQGVHMGRHSAGVDLTDALRLAPHGPDKIAAMAVTGRLVPSEPHKTPLHERVFYFMAYMNLTIVFVIVLILSLWRWG